MNTLTFNNITLHSISRSDNQIWLTSADLAKALGYVDANSVNRILSRNKDEFTDNMTQVVEGVNLTTSSKTKGLTTTTRIFSLRGCHLLAMFSRTKVAKDFRKWVLDILDKEVGVPTVEHEELPSTVKDRNGLIKTVHMAVKRLDLGFSEAFNLVLHRFNVAHVGDLTQSQVGEAVEYLHRLMFTGNAATYHPAQSNEPSDNTVYTEDVAIYKQLMKSGKFIAEVDGNGRLIMRELFSDEFITTMQDLPAVIRRQSNYSLEELSQINVATSQLIAMASHSISKRIITHDNQA
ncbi:BRO-N domain-containing protein [Psychrobacter alimentarius]|uniref:BRO-N domain-containing protein n=1 Tax=Psychrobacter alimentarius TaxID=261164 RepID=UPI003FD5482B